MLACNVSWAVRLMGNNSHGLGIVKNFQHLVKVLRAVKAMPTRFAPLMPVYFWKDHYPKIEKCVTICVIS